jgi:small subunit ribosomal protein S16
MGRKKRPFYRIVAIDSRKRRDGEYIEKIGHYDPITRPATLVVDHDKAVKWLKEGAVVSDTVRSLFKRDGVMLRWDMTKREYEQVKIEEAVKAHRDHRLAKLEAKDKPAEKPAPKAEAKPEPKAEAKEEPKEEPKVEAEEAKPAEEAEAAEAPEADK